METYVYQIATSAGRVLLNPLVLTISVLAMVALATGVAGRVAVVVENRLHTTTRTANRR